MRGKRSRLATRVAFAASALALFFVLMMGWGAWVVTARLIRDQFHELLLAEAALRAEKAADLMAGAAQHFRALANNSVVANALADSVGREAYLQPLLEDVAEVNGIPVGLSVTDYKGRPLVSGRRPAIHSADPWVAAAVTAGRARVRVIAGPQVAVALPVIFANTGTPEGALVWSMGLGDLARRVAPVTGNTVGELLVEVDGQKLALALNNDAPLERDTLHAEVPVPLPALLSDLHMGVRVYGDQTVLDNSLNRLATTFLTLAALATLLVVVLASLLGRRLTEALSRLAEAATSFAFGKGDREAFVIAGNDEIAQLGTAFAGMVERLDQAYRDLERRNQSQLSGAERLAQLGSASWEPQSGRQVWSDQFHALLGLVPGEVDLSRDSFCSWIHADDRAHLMETLNQAIISGSGRVVEDVRLLRSDGAERVGQLRAEVIRGGALDGGNRVDITIQDITERKRLENKLDALVRELSRSNEELEQFAYAASHDLRQPLRTVRSYVTLVEESIDDKLDDETREFMGFIVDGVRRMDTLITDLLAYSRVGRTSRDGPVDSGRAADLALADLHMDLDEATAQVSLPPRMPVVMGDAGEMARLFQNLIGNAVKYRSTERSPAIVVEVSDGGDHWDFSVSDNGIGIPSEHGERIFGIFQRLHARHEYEGTGIGLAICRKVVERHGGRIWCEPKAEGSVFRFTWPKMPHTAAP